MIRIIAESVVCADRQAEYLAVVAELVEKSRAEDGCLDYGLWRSMADPTRFTMMECWTDQAAIDRHNASEHFTRIVPLMAALRKSSMVVKYEKVM